MRMGEGEMSRENEEQNNAEVQETGMMNIQNAIQIGKKKWKS